MRACPECNYPYPDDQPFCTRDGRPLGGGDVENAMTVANPARTPKPKSPGGNRFAVEDPDDAVLLGATLGSYRVIQLLGRGGMGRVYLAEHVLLGRQAALKLLRSEYAAKRDAVARFFQEAKAVSRIRHKNIVDITDFVELPNGETFIVMDLLEGLALGEMFRRQTPISVADGLCFMMQVCEGLEAAHSEGIVHRDLKPDNIFVCATPGDGQVKILDFGVAKLLGSRESAWQTVQGSIVGTPAYMSPEQAAGIEVDPRADLYSMGAILYEMFAKRRVFEARSFGEFVLKHMNEEPLPLSEVPGSIPVPRILERTIMRCLEKRPDDRFQTARELREVLYEALTIVEMEPDQALVERKRRRKRRMTMGAIAAVLGLAMLAFWRNNTPPPSARTIKKTIAPPPETQPLPVQPEVPPGVGQGPHAEPIGMQLAKPLEEGPKRNLPPIPPLPMLEEEPPARVQRRPKRVSTAPARPKAENPPEKVEKPRPKGVPSSSDTLNPFDGD